MENVRSAQRFVGKAVACAGPFALWGSGVPHKSQFQLFGYYEELMIPDSIPKGLKKGMAIGSGKAIRGMTTEEKKAYRKQFPALQMGGKSAERKAKTAAWATIPPELANCVADYAERLLELKSEAQPLARSSL
jgi:hypothetical protein